MQAADVMTHPVITTTADATIEEVAALMLKHRISGLPVTAEDGSVIGMVSEGDLLRRAEIGTENRRPHWLEFIIGPGRLAGEYVRSHARRVADVMTKDVVSITPQTALAEAVALMERRRIKRLPVLESGRIAGILCRADLLRALSGLLGQAGGRLASDEQIRQGIMAEINKQPWAPRASVRVGVAKGVVEFYGSITDEREREALRVAAENFPGVAAVHDHLVWVEPMSGMVLDAPSAATSSPPPHERAPVESENPPVSR